MRNSKKISPHSSLCCAMPVTPYKTPRAGNRSPCRRANSKPSFPMEQVPTSSRGQTRGNEKPLAELWGRRERLLGRGEFELPTRSLARSRPKSHAELARVPRGERLGLYAHVAEEEEHWNVRCAAVDDS